MDTQYLQREYLRTSHRFHRVHMSFINAGLHRGEFFVLETLYRHQRQNPDVVGMYASKLASAMGMLPPGVSRLLRALETKGYIERIVDSENRRNTYIRLTDIGETVRNQTHGRLHAHMERVLSSVGTENMEAFLVLWNQMLDAMENELKTTDERGSECSDYLNI